jgi:dTDP-4-amino-4,6-dideoxygalactose transaminase
MKVGVPKETLPGERRVALVPDVLLKLKAAGIETRVFYPVALHRQPCFAEYGGTEQRFPVSEAAAEEILCLPIHPFLRQEHVSVVCEALAAALVS